MLKNNSVFLKLHDYFFEKTYRRIQNMPPRTIQGPITWPLYRRTEENQKITHFLSSAKDPLGFEENSKNILFLVGPKNVGKSWFLKSTCKNKLIIDNQHITLDGFMSQFKNQIVEYMQQNDMITFDLIVEVAQKCYHDRYLNVYFHKFLKEKNIKIEFISKPIVLEDNQFQDTFEFQFWQEDALQLNVNSDTLNFKELLQQATQNQTQEQSLMMILDFIQQLEYSKIHNPYDITSTTGVIEQIQFLFNLLNSKRLETEFGLIILGIDKLFQYYKHDLEASNFLDHLILSTFNNTGIRNHFPIILESSNSKFFNRDLMEIMHSDLHNFSHLDIDHIPQERIPIQVEDIFSSHEIQAVHQRIGGSLSDWHKLTKNAVEIEQFSIKEWLTQKDQKLKNQFDYLCNQVYLNPNVSGLLDSHEIDFEFHNILSLIKRFNGVLFTGTFYADAELMHRPMVNALQEEYILYHPKHKSHLHFSQQIYFEYYTEIWNDYKNKLNLYDKLKFIWKSIRKYQHYHLKPRFRGSWHYIQVLEPREKDDDDLKTGYRPYHEHYI